MSIYLSMAALFFACGSDSGGNDESSDETVFSGEEKIIVHAADISKGLGFGLDVAVSDDYAIVGSPWYTFTDDYSNTVLSAGAVSFLEKNDDGIWEVKQTMIESTPCYCHKLGYSVSISGTYAAAGCQSGFGAIIYERTEGGTWEEKQVIDLFEENTLSGGDVSISGEYLMINKYIFERNSEGTWEEKQELNGSDISVNEISSFGNSVSINGEFAIVGAPYKTVSKATMAGTVYIYERGSDGIWEEKAIVHNSDGEAFSYFGTKVCISGDYAIISDGGTSHSDDDEERKSGSAYIIERSSEGNWEQKAVLQASDIQDNDWFAGGARDYYSGTVSISGNYAVIGAFMEDGGYDTYGTDIAVDAGAAYVFKRDSSGNWNEVYILHASDLQEYDSFGFSVAVNGSNVLVGAPCEDGGEGDGYSLSGAVYFFE